MSTASTRRPIDVPLLYEGQRLTQEEFHRRYETYPKHVKFELIGGVVYRTLPHSIPHGTRVPELSGLFMLYDSATPGLEGLTNATIILGESSEPQPDLTLRISPEWGGQSSTNSDDYLQGPPELVAEIAYSSRDIEMNQKRLDYQRGGIVEYLVWCIDEREIHWFDFDSGKEIKRNRQGVYRSRVFPGLWIDGEAMLDRDTQRIVAALQKGLASREHASFVRRLEKARRKLASAGEQDV